MIKTGARPLARNKRAKLVARTFSDSLSAPIQNPPSLSCSWTSSSAPRRYQSFWPKNADAGQPAGPLQAVKIVKLPLLAVAEILPDLEVVGEPVDSGLEVRLIPPLPQF